ncbi:MAG: AMP-binding protein, partial [Pseudomonadota bacterium]
MDIETATQTGTLSALYASSKPDAVAVMDATDQRTFRELHENANRLARAFQNAGLSSGDGVALVCSNRCEFIEVLLACLRSGLRLTPVNWHLSHSDAEYIISNCEAKALLIEDRFVDSIWSGGEIHVDLALCIGLAKPGLKSYAEVISQVDPDDLSAPVHGNIMLYTSGTTGRPKGVVYPLVGV